MAKMLERSHSKTEKRAIERIRDRYVEAVKRGEDPYRKTDGMTHRLVVLKEGRRQGRLEAAKLLFSLQKTSKGRTPLVVAWDCLTSCVVTDDAVATFAHGSFALAPMQMHALIDTSVIHNNIETSLVQACLDDGYEAWTNPVDSSTARESDCPVCKHHGLDFRGFKSGATRVAIAICPKCGHQFDF